MLRNSIVDWGVRACSPLPIDLQCALIEWKVSKGESGLIELEWTKNQWIKWLPFYIISKILCASKGEHLGSDHCFVNTILPFL